MKFRLAEGGGERFYYLGVEDDGYPRGLDPPDLQTSISTLNVMAAQVWSLGGMEGREDVGVGRLGGWGGQGIELDHSLGRGRRSFWGGAGDPDI